MGTATCATTAGQAWGAVEGFSFGEGRPLPDRRYSFLPAAMYPRAGCVDGFQFAEVQFGEMVRVSSICKYDPARLALDMQTCDLVLLGAGFSYAATNGELPLMSGFCDRAEVSKYPTLCGVLEAEGVDYRTANVEQTFTSLVQMRGAPPALHAIFPPQSLWECCEPEKEFREYAIERLCTRCVQLDTPAAFLLEKLQEAATVISLNYDTVAELILRHHSHRRYGRCTCRCPHGKMLGLLKRNCECFDFDSVKADDWTGSILKLHGSIAWKRCSNQICCNRSCIDAHCCAHPHDDYVCENCYGDCDPVIVVPSPSKDIVEFLGLAAVWNAAHVAMTHARHVVIYGYSLPPSDAMLRGVICRAVREGRVLEKVTIVDRYPDAVAEQFTSLLPPDLDIDVVQVLAPPLGSRIRCQRLVLPR